MQEADFELDMNGNKDNGRFSCRFCNTAGTETCSISGKCICRAWYDGNQCEHCRFANDFVLAPNGSCIPCPCGGRPMHECFQSRMCAINSSVAFREGTAASALFIATLSAVICVLVYLIWRVLKRAKHLRTAVATRRYRDEDCAVSEAGAFDDDGPNWKDEDQLMPSNHPRNHLLLTPISDQSSACTSLYYIPSPVGPPVAPISGSRSVSSFLTHLQKGASCGQSMTNAASIPAVLNVDNVGWDESGYPKNGMRISSSCSEYYFLSVQEDDD